ncbi:MAG: HlyD family efflux transporter periplasmic adaptor subunit, partial [Amphritea sp.]|nr:HlyD family efflux transporter periplasmic adaptor subunit [Amphritea sp.]
EAESGIGIHIGNSAGHALFALRRQQSLFRGILPQLLKRKVLFVSLAVLVLFIPVRLSTLAPVEVIPKDPYVVAAPLDGVVEAVTVHPNQVIKKGDLLAHIETNTLESEEAITHQELLVAQAELKTVQQSGFMDPRHKARFAELESQVKLRMIQWQYAQERLSRAEILSDISGVAVLGDPSEWKGRPVKVGERIFLVADPAQVEFEVMLPVKDSIALRPAADVRVFLDNDPLRAWSSRLKHATYEPRPTPDQQVAYRLVVSLLPHEDAPPRIGLRGTAKIYGERVSLFFYLFRRPITSVRQWLGW